MRVKQDKCETLVSSHTSVAIDLQGWRTAAQQLPVINLYLLESLLGLSVMWLHSPILKW